MKPASRNRRLLVLALAAAASLLELGPIVTLLKGGNDVLAVLLAGLAYQIGNAAPRPSVLAGRLTTSLCALGGAALFLLSPLATPAWLVAIAILSWSLQGVRRNIISVDSGDAPTTVQKRSARVIGFVLAGFAPTVGWLVAILLVITCALASEQPTPSKDKARILSFGHPLEWTMLVHQTHYFA